MKNVLLVRSTPNDLDIEAYNVQQIGIGRCFVDKKINYDFVTLKKNEPRKSIVFYEKEGYKATCLEMPRFRLLRWGINLKICDNSFLDKYDLIICQEYYQLETFLISRKSKNVCMYSGPYWNMFMLPFSSYFFDLFLTRKINQNIKCKFVKSALAKDFLESKGYTNVIDIGVGLDLERFENISIKEDTKIIVKYMDENPCILYVGNLNENKNLPFLLNVFTELSKRRPELRLVLIGKSKQTYLKKLVGMKDESYAKKEFLKLDKAVLDKIVHIERVENPQLQFIYPKAKAFLLPSKKEIFGMVLLEAMYLGAPVVCSNNGGAISLLKGNDCGQALDEFSVSKWVNATLKYIDDGKYAKDTAKNARNRILDHFTWDAIVGKIINAME